MSTLHTINGVPVCSISPHFYGSTVVVQYESFIQMGTEITRLRSALREAVAIIDEDRSGAKSGWSHEDSAKLERLRALAK